MQVIFAALQHFLDIGADPVDPRSALTTLAAWVQVDDTRLMPGAADLACTSGNSQLTLRHRSTDGPACLFIADETPLQQTPGVSENRG